MKVKKGNIVQFGGSYHIVDSVDSKAKTVTFSYRGGDGEQVSKTINFDEITQVFNKKKR